MIIQFPGIILGMLGGVICYYLDGETSFGSAFWGYCLGVVVMVLDSIIVHTLERS